MMFDVEKKPNDEISAHADISALVVAGNTELLDAGLEGGSLQAKAGGGATWSADDPTGFAECPEDMFAFGGFQRRGKR